MVVSDMAAKGGKAEPPAQEHVLGEAFPIWLVIVWETFQESRMRIIGGTAARRKLKAPKGLAVRPTPDLVRQAVFNSLGTRVVEAAVLELFGGTGALCLESLSRGAKHAVCVELSRRNALGIRANFEALKLPAHALSIWVKDVFSALPALVVRSERYDLIFADPPYGEKNAGERSRSDAQKLLDDPSLPALLKGEGFFVLGHAKRDRLEVTPAWEETKCLRHGDSIMRFLRTARQPKPETEDTSAAAGSGPPTPRRSGENKWAAQQPRPTH